LNGFDITLAILAGLLVLLGLAKGLARLLIGIAALVAAFMLAAQFHEALALRLPWLDIPADARRLVAYLLIFFGTMIAGGIAAWLVRRLLKAAMLGWADRLAGAAVGLLAAALIAGLLLLPLVAYSPFGERALRDSLLAPYVTVVADLARRVVPSELSESYRQRVEELRRYWREQWDAAPQAAARTA
jgi:membrane protein required for colicin V production